ncbi:MAG TPA: type II toxin-antitoxin system RelE/ParE family toxin [Humisphaera sp.]
MKLAFAEEAKAELRQAFEWYGPGPGRDFLLAIGAAVRKVREHPLRWPVIRGEVRRYRTDKYPYGILYKVKPDHIRILAIMHLHRDPEYWVERDREP